MNRSYKIIQELTKSKGTKIKKQIITDNKDNVIFVEGLHIALNSMITFGVNKIDVIKEEDGYGSHWGDFRELTNKLSNRVLSGNKAKEAISTFAQGVTVDAWNYWYSRILKKDLNCGIAVKSVNSAFKGNKDLMIPVFECQLASSSPEVEDLKGKKYVDVKLDGVRCLALIKNDKVTLYSRNGKQFYNFNNIEDILYEVIKDESYSINNGIVLDGEITSTNFQKLMTQVNRKKDINTDDSVFNVFDIVTMDEFKGVIKTTQETREVNLVGFINKFSNVFKDKIINVKKNVVDFDSINGKDVFMDMFKTATTDGFEGLMLKDMQAPYKTGRNKNWLKMKPFIEVTLVIDTFEEGVKKNTGKLGAFICTSAEEDVDMVPVNIGGGLSDIQREDFWNNRENLVGELIEVRADSFTESNKDGKVSLRFPRFLRFRGMVPGEKL